MLKGYSLEMQHLPTKQIEYWFEAEIMCSKIEDMYRILMERDPVGTAKEVNAKFLAIASSHYGQMGGCRYLPPSGKHQEGNAAEYSDEQL